MSGLNSDSPAVISLNRTALQAMYHAVTGKTENISKVLRKNVVITHSDFIQLYDCLNQSIHHYSIVTEPSVTIVVKKSTSESIQYSSWARFRDFEVNGQDVTSEVVLKLELLIKLPNTVSPQRLSINISIDSGLPVISEKSKIEREAFFEFILFFVAEEFRTVEISIDFVDFILAKIFVAVVEEWFAKIETTPVSRPINFLVKNHTTVNSIVNQFGRLGIAAFLSSYVWFNNNEIGRLGQFAYSFSIALFWWSLFSVFISYFRRTFNFRLASSILPSVILFTAGDRKAYERAISARASFYKITSGLIWMVVANTSESTF